jgi:hypothetical protein
VDQVYTLTEEGYDEDQVWKALRKTRWDEDKARAELLTYKMNDVNLTSSESEYWQSETDTEEDCESIGRMEEEIFKMDMEESRGERLEEEILKLKFAYPRDEDLLEVITNLEEGEIELEEAIEEVKKCKELEFDEEENESWYDEIIEEQSKTDLCFDPSNFEMLVREIILAHGFTKIEDEVFEILQHMGEEHITKAFQKGLLVTIMSKEEETTPSHVNQALSMTS